MDRFDVERAPLCPARVREIGRLSTMFTSEATTEGICVRVQSRFDPSRSQPESQRWFFLYTVTITNEGDAAVQLLDRHWVITDGNGIVHEVRGDGVVGEQPELDPGESFEYTSGCPLATEIGTMKGSYGMSDRAGRRFDVEIAEFTLSEPYVVN